MKLRLMERHFGCETSTMVMCAPLVEANRLLHGAWTTVVGL